MRRLLIGLSVFVLEDVFRRFVLVFFLLWLLFFLRFFLLPVEVFVFDRPLVLDPRPPRPRPRVLLLPRPRPRPRPRTVLPRPRAEATVRALRVVSTREESHQLGYGRLICNTAFYNPRPSHFSRVRLV